MLQNLRQEFSLCIAHFGIIISLQNLFSLLNSEIIRTVVDSSLGGYQDNKVCNAVVQNGKDAGQNSSMSRFQRSKSTPRGKFML